ncbi:MULTISPECIES: ribosome maturation factor RimP [Auritidibacter]|uniref:Ribosome maturation factor RimP n=2 Tax=Auritidibacter ignavus TaxID=678932 RepID=A0AAJ6AKV6_9MICC|nr:MULTISPECIES: ribosome assembly cofactor RimP [Auritidibacter]AXR73825.1 ribosome assembly cofactor RimP [Auritidibacter sp. NML130574]NIH72275.1 ribosome maturation factor RimP [Auritidibacter ignavus]PXA77175.1 ribosome assembly cofactor RimP [Auritidibacter sp. NML100628]PXA78970.1 ribosome assembly cofactor RimP [Auritidibacter sp. NML120636]RMX23717.1 ribosome assembly cofactor RimP [Auritidibacter ignavus]
MASRFFARTHAESSEDVSEKTVEMRSPLEQLIATALTDQQVWVEDVEVTGTPGSKVLTVVIDARTGTEGLSLDEIATSSQVVSDALDAYTGPLPEIGDDAYQLEVSTPGVGRPLVRPHHWQRNLGRTVEAELTGQPGRQRARIDDVDDTGVELTLIIPGAKKGMPEKVGERAHYSFDDITDAQVQVKLKQA